MRLEAISAVPETTKRVLHDPQHWIERAEDARRLAAQILDPVPHSTMLEIAESYESLARWAADQSQEEQKK
jgi:hypothetical protein